MDLTSIVAFLQTNAVQLAVAVIMLNIEYFLGRTDLVQANSTLELALNIVKNIAQRIKDLGKPKV